MSKHPTFYNGGGLMRVVKAARCSMLGLSAAWQHESAFRQELMLAMLFTPLGLWLGQTMEQRILLVGSMVLVIIVELLNSAVEAAIDRIGPERHELSGRAKDLGSAAVFLALWMVALIWGAIAWQRFLS